MRRSPSGYQDPYLGKIHLDSRPHLPMGFGMNLTMYPGSPLIVHVPLWILCGYESSGCVIGLVLECFPCDFSSFFPVFFVFFVGSPSNSCKITSKGLALYHLGSELWLTRIWSSSPSFSSLILLFFCPNSKIPTKNSHTKFFAFCWFL